jgi:competence protein ComEC
MAESGTATKVRDGVVVEDAGTRERGRALPVLLPDQGLPTERLTRRPASPRIGVLFAKAFWQEAVQEEEARGTLFVLSAVCLAAGAAVYQTLDREPAIWPAAAALIVMALLAMRARRTGSRGFVAPVLCAAMLAGFLAGRIETLGGAVLLDGPVTTTVTGEVLSREFDEGGRTRYLLRLLATADPELKRPPGRARLTATASHEPFAPGAIITGRARLSPPSGPAYPGGHDFARSAYASGIGAFGFFYRAPDVDADTALVTHGPVERLRAGITTLRIKIATRVRTVVGGDPGALIAALTVSDRRGISEATVEALRATGLAHILAISGLHMALAAGTFFLGLRKLTALFPGLVERFPVKKIAAVAALAIATSYLAISGAGVATQRAWLMMTIMFVAVLLDRPALTMRNVALAGIVITLVTPSAVISPGFQMSFAATVALIATYAAWSRRRGRAERGAPSGPVFLPTFAVTLLRGILGLAVTSLVAGLATGLFAAWHFHRAAGLGLIANLLAMPLVSFVVMPAGLIAMLAMPFRLDAWPLAIMGKGLEGVLAAARYVQGLGGDAVTGRIGLAAILFAGGGFLILTLLSSRLRLVGLAPIALGLVLTLPPFAQAPPDLFVSEDGRLLGLVGDSAIATNAERPSDFILEQWQRAYRRADHLAPVTMATATLEALSDQARRTPGRFICSSRSRCVAETGGKLVVAIGEPADFGAACDVADIVVLSVPIRTRRCFSGAVLATARTLRETGALAIDTGGGAIAVTTALGDVIRPWTIQRRYDWRSDSFTLPDAMSARAVSATGDRHRNILMEGDADTKKPANMAFAGAEKTNGSAEGQ